MSDRICPACYTPLAVDEELQTCIECSGEFGPCCMEDGMCTGCSEDEGEPGAGYVDQGKDE